MLNQYGFYFDVLYTMTTTADGQAQKAHYVFKEDSSIEIYGTGWIDETTYISGALIDYESAEAANYRDRIIRDRQQI